MLNRRVTFLLQFLSMLNRSMSFSLCFLSVLNKKITFFALILSSSGRSHVSLLFAIEEHDVADSFATCKGLVPCVHDKPYGLCGRKPP